MFIFEATWSPWQHLLTKCCCYWERDTGCLFTTTYLVSSPWRPAQVYVEQEQLFFTNVKHGYSYLEDKSFLWNENKWGVKFYSRAKENLPLENFCHIWGPPKPHRKSYVFWHTAITIPGRQRIGLCFVPCKISDMDSLCTRSHWFQTTLPFFSHYTSL